MPKMNPLLAAKSAMRDVFGCGCTLENGTFVYCDDKRLPEDIRNDCCCMESAKQVLQAFGENSSSTIDFHIEHHLNNSHLLPKE